MTVDRPPNLLPPAATPSGYGPLVPCRDVVCTDHRARLHDRNTRLTDEARIDRTALREALRLLAEHDPRAAMVLHRWRRREYRHLDQAEARRRGVIA
mgnify:CR=1 FL=1